VLQSLKLCPEARFLFLVCLTDMLTSLALFHFHLAWEFNPLLAGAAAAGWLPFAALKTATFAPALWIVNWHAYRRPRFVRPLLRWAGWTYLALYVAFSALALYSP